MALRILDRKALRAKGVPFSNVHLLRLEKAGKFPRRFSLTENRIAWLETDVDAWIEERASSRHKGSVAPALAGGADARPA
jgi:prophage regulatory protein